MTIRTFGFGENVIIFKKQQTFFVDIEQIIHFLKILMSKPIYFKEK